MTTSSKYRIGLIETKCRNHEISAKAKMWNTENSEITIFTTRKLFPQIEEELKGQTENFEWVLDKEGESYTKYLKRIEKICSERIDLAYINTLRTWHFLFFNPKCPTLPIISNLNYWLVDTKGIKRYFSKFKAWENIIHHNPVANAIIGPAIRKKILSQYAGVIVEYPSFVEKAKELGYKKPVYFLPNRPFEGLPEIKKSEKIRFALPGMIAQNRRIYEPVLETFEKLFTEHNDKIELFLLGKPLGDYGKTITDWCGQLKDKGYNIWYPLEYVPATFLEETLYSSDVIIAPLKLNYHSVTVNEVYSHTKGTGTFSDTVKFAKPCIVPAGYNITPEIESSYLPYQNKEELHDLIEKFIIDADYRQKLQEKALENSEKFSLAKMNAETDRIKQEMIPSS